MFTPLTNVYNKFRVNTTVQTMQPIVYTMYYVPAQDKKAHICFQDEKYIHL